MRSPGTRCASRSSNPNPNPNPNPSPNLNPNPNPNPNQDDGSVVTWGDHNAGGSSRLVSNTLDQKGVTKIVASGSSFTALRTIF